jgi:hypothetical protein
MTHSLSVTVVILIFLSAFGSPLARADDGVFYASGNTLIPIHESSISLKKEILKLKKDKDYLDVDVYFEFENPGKVHKEIVGFVTPPGGGSEEDPKMPFINGFAVTVNDHNLGYKLSRFGPTGFRLPKRYRTAADSDDFIFYFPVTFVPGINKVHHSYRIRAGAGQSDESEYLYRLVTGKSWANNEMEDFTLIVDMGPDSYFYLPQTFWKSSEDIPWKVVGEGSISRAFASHESLQRDTMSLRMVKMHTGSIECHMMHFKPDYDLGFGIPRFYDFYWWEPTWTKGSEENPANVFTNLSQSSSYDIAMNQPDSSELVKLSNQDLVILKNLPFAFHDCTFKSEVLTQYFSKFNWYIPYPTRFPEMKLLTQDEGKLITAVEQEERRREKR